MTEAIASGQKTDPGHFLISGATGFLGQQLVRHLIAKGKRVTCVSRDPGRARRSFEEQGLQQGLDCRGWEQRWLPSEGRPVDVVVNLAGSQAVGVRWTKRAKAEILSSRVEATRQLLENLAPAREGAAR